MDVLRTVSGGQCTVHGNGAVPVTGDSNNGVRTMDTREEDRKRQYAGTLDSKQGEWTVIKRNEQ